MVTGNHAQARRIACRTFLSEYAAENKVTRDRGKSHPGYADEAISVNRNADASPPPYAILLENDRLRKAFSGAAVPF
jgi:hypothetical protein